MVSSANHDKRRSAGRLRPEDLCPDVSASSM